MAVGSNGVALPVRRGYPGTRRGRSAAKDRAPIRGPRTVRTRGGGVLPLPANDNTPPRLPPQSRRLPIIRVAAGAALAFGVVDWLDGIRDPLQYRNGFAGFTKYAAREPLTVPPPWGRVRDSSPWPSFWNDSDNGWLDKQYISYYTEVPASQPGFGVWVAVEDVQYGPPNVTFGWQYEDWRRLPGTVGDVPIRPAVAPMFVPETPWQVHPRAVPPLAVSVPQPVPFWAIPELQIDEIPELGRQVGPGTVPATVQTEFPEEVPFRRIDEVPLNSGPWVASPPVGRVNEQEFTLGSISTNTRPRVRLRQKPEVRQKDKNRERKYRPRWAGKAWALIGFVTEANDVFEAFWKGLPGKLKRRAFVENGYKKLSQLDKARFLARHWREVDVDRFIKELIENQVEDFIYGKIGQAAGAASREANRPVGYQTGDANRDYVTDLPLKPGEERAPDPVSEFGQWVSSLNPVEVDKNFGQVFDAALDWWFEE